jgi:hypothetical protein
LKGVKMKRARSVSVLYNDGGFAVMTLDSGGVRVGIPLSYKDYPYTEPHKGRVEAIIALCFAQPTDFDDRMYYLLK